MQCPDFYEGVPPDRGGYVLLLSLGVESEIPIGRLRTMRFQSGYYAYIGSAMGGLKQRILRHIRNKKKRHWHIDYLMEKALLDNIIVCKSEKRIECDIAGEIRKEYSVINGFGSSDCKCSGHLFYSKSAMSEGIMKNLISAGMEPRLIRM